MNAHTCPGVDFSVCALARVYLNTFSCVLMCTGVIYAYLSILCLLACVLVKISPSGYGCICVFVCACAREIKSLCANKRVCFFIDLCMHIYVCVHRFAEESLIIDSKKKQTNHKTFKSQLFVTNFCVLFLKSHCSLFQHAY